jgi:hypothetical protein
MQMQYYHLRCAVLAGDLQARCFLLEVVPGRTRGMCEVGGALAARAVG